MKLCKERNILAYHVKDLCVPQVENHCFRPLSHRFAKLIKETNCSLRRDERIRQPKQCSKILFSSVLSLCLLQRAIFDSSLSILNVWPNFLSTPIPRKRSGSATTLLENCCLYLTERNTNILGVITLIGPQAFALC